jgi:hypothetical protein
MAKANRRRQKGNISGKRPPGGVALHPVIMQADVPEAQRRRFVHEVATVANPYGEMMQDGQIKQHKACRRVPHFETLYRSRVIDKTVFVVLEWYANRLARAEGGLFKCGLDTSGTGGGSAGSHIPTTMAAMEARSDVTWARGFIPWDLLPAFDGVMAMGETFEAIGARVYPHLCLDRGKRRASSAFKIAANHLLLGCGHLLMVYVPDQDRQIGA